MHERRLTEVARTPRLIVAVPTRNEEPVIAGVLSGIAQATAPVCAGIMVLDDSDDHTCDQVLGFAETPEASSRWFTLMHREQGERKGGLGSIVMAGIERARQAGAEYFALMDGDGQHPDGAVLQLLARAEATGADLVVGSRYIAGGSSGGRQGLSPIRVLVSRAATLLAKGLFPRRLRGYTDLASGIFLVRVKSVDVERVYADGFKVLLSLATVHEWHHEEVAYIFGDRIAGDSKAGAAEGLKFLRLVAALRLRNWRTTLGRPGIRQQA